MTLEELKQITEEQFDINFRYHEYKYNISILRYSRGKEGIDVNIYKYLMKEKEGKEFISMSIWDENGGHSRTCDTVEEFFRELENHGIQKKHAEQIRLF